MEFKNKNGKNIQCKMSCIPIRLCEFPAKELVLAVVYGFGKESMLLLSQLKMQEKKKLYHIIAILSHDNGYPFWDVSYRPPRVPHVSFSPSICHIYHT